MEAELNFDQIFLGHSDEVGGGHLATRADVEEAREDEGLLLSNEADLFCRLITMHGQMPSEAYTHAFMVTDEDGIITKPDMPAYQARVLLRQPEVKARIEEIRAEVVKWGKTSVEEVEANYRRIALDPTVKHSDRIAATKALCALRGFDAQPENQQGAVINIVMPWVPNQLGRGVTIDHETS
jgi:hypothetical protein